MDKVDTDKLSLDVAKEVMGFTVEPVIHGKQKWWRVLQRIPLTDDVFSFGDSKAHGGSSGDEAILEWVGYARIIHYAFEVVDVLDQCLPSICHSPDQRVTPVKWYWTVSFETLGENISSEAINQSLPVAICLAALRFRRALTDEQWASYLEERRNGRSGENRDEGSDGV